jgi:O-antigen ligase
MAATLTGVAFSQFLLTTNRWLRLAWGGLLAVLLAVMAALATGGDLIKTSADLFADLFYDYLPYLTLGEGSDNIRELSGREPLWDDLWKQVPDTLFLGHGYGAFWTSETLNRIYASIGWPAVNAHNGYLDELLGTGLIGLTLFAAFLIRSFARAAACEGPAKRDGVLVMTWIVVFCCFNSMDSILQNLHSHMPAYFLLIAIYALSARSSRWRESEAIELSLSPSLNPHELISQAKGLK